MTLLLRLSLIVEVYVQAARKVDRGRAMRPEYPPVVVSTAKGHDCFRISTSWNHGQISSLAEFTYPERFCKLGEVFCSGVHLARSSCWGIKSQISESQTVTIFATVVSIHTHSIEHVKQHTKIAKTANFTDEELTPRQSAPTDQNAWPLKRPSQRRRLN